MYKPIVTDMIKIINIYGKKVKNTMGRKRTSNKERILISVDKDILNWLKENDINRSILFTEAAEKKLEEYKKISKKM